MIEQPEAIVPDGGVTDEPMPMEWMGNAEAYLDPPAEYVARPLQETTP